MSTEDFIIDLFIRVDSVVGDLPKHPDAHLYPSELVTLGLLFALKGVGRAASTAGSTTTIGTGSCTCLNAPGCFASWRPMPLGPSSSWPIRLPWAWPTPTASS